MSVKEAQSVMIKARMRHTGLTETQVAHNEAGKPNAGNIHGIMCLRGELSNDQWHAAEWFLGTRASYLRSIETHDEMLKTGEGPSPSTNDDAHAEWCAAMKKRWDALRNCIQAASIEQRSPIMSAIDVMLVRGHYLPHQSGDLRIGLNAIHREFLQGRRNRA